MMVLFFLVGLAVGSFLNVVIERLGTKESVVWGASRCPHCTQGLSARDLVPILSYVFLAGRCRYCGKSISLQYPLVEFGTGLAFVWVIWVFPLWYDRVFWLFFVALFIAIAAFDIKRKEVPHALLWPLVCGALWYVFASPFFDAWQGNGLPLLQAAREHLGGASLTGGFILTLVLLTREQAMGMGDAPLAGLQGLLLGFPQGVYALMASFILGALVGVGLIAFGRAGLKTAVPFGPFLLAGLLLFAFFVPFDIFPCALLPSLSS